MYMKVLCIIKLIPLMPGPYGHPSTAEGYHRGSVGFEGVALATTAPAPAAKHTHNWVEFKLGAWLQ